MKYTRKTNKLSWRHLDVFSCWPGVFRPEPSTWCSASTSEAWSLDAYESWCSTTPEIPCDNIIYIYIYIYIISIVTNQQRYSWWFTWILGTHKNLCILNLCWNYGKLSLNFHGSVPLASSAATSCRRSAWTFYTLLCPWDTMWRSMTSITCVSSAGSGLCLYSFASNKARVRLLSAQILSNAESGNNSENVSHSYPLKPTNNQLLGDIKKSAWFMSLQGLHVSYAIVATLRINTFMIFIE